MEVRIVDRRTNALLERTELRFQIAHSGAPSPPRDEVRGELAKQLKVPKERLIVEAMHARFGIAETTGEALLYDSPQGRDRVTREHILVRNGLRQPAAPATAEPAKAPPAPKEATAAEPAKPAPAERPPKAKSEAPSHAAPPEHAPKARAEEAAKAAPAEHPPKTKSEEPAAPAPAKATPEPKKPRPKKAG